jgi:S-adenosylmethionine/arginine decarboxylase-like enzyme
MWGRHLMINAKACNKNLIGSYPNIYRFTKDLVQQIDMKAYGEPQIHHFGSGNKSGYTLVQLIHTSNITSHFCDETGDLYLDIFSCKDFCEYKAKEIIQQYFQPIQIHSKLILRDANHPME